MIHKGFDFTQLGGFPFTQDTLALMQDAGGDLSAAIAALVGNNVIITGVEPQDTQLTPGWIVYQEQLIPFAGGANTGFIKVVENKTRLTFEDGVSREVQFQKVAEPNLSGIALRDFKRLRPYREISSQFGRQARLIKTDSEGNFFKIVRMLDDMVHVEAKIKLSAEELNAGKDYKIEGLPFSFGQEDDNLSYQLVLVPGTNKPLAIYCKIQAESDFIRVRGIDIPSIIQSFDSECHIVFSAMFFVDSTEE